MQGYKFNLTHINYDHDGCEDAKMRIVWTRFRDDPMANSQSYEKLHLKDSANNVLTEKYITLGTVQELNTLIEEDDDGHVVVEATLPTYEFHY